MELKDRLHSLEEVFSAAHGGDLSEVDKVIKLEEAVMLMQKDESLHRLRDACVNGTDGHEINYLKALEWAQQIVEHDIKWLGSEHRMTLIDKKAFAELLLINADFRNAADLFHELRLTWEKQHGAEHRLTLTAQQGEADALMGLGKYHKARKLTEQVLACRKAKLGDQHPATLASAHSLAVLLRKQGKKASALSLAEKTYQARRDVLGSINPDTLASQLFLWELKQPHRLPEREKLFFKLYSACRNALGERHPVTLLAMYDYEKARGKQGRYLEAALDLVDCHDLQMQILGSDHPDAMRMMSFESYCWFRFGDLQMWGKCLSMQYWSMRMRIYDWEMWQIYRLEKWSLLRKQRKKQAADRT